MKFLFYCNRKNVDLESGTVYILKSKSGKPREVPISPKLAKIFEKLGPKSDGKVFGVPNITLRREFGKALKTAQILNFRFHDLRHTFRAGL
ncbi:tyrosine-type recombinase/integrase [Elusimicrobiota bacterium]